MTNLTTTFTTKSFAGSILELEDKDGKLVRRWRPTSPMWYETELRKFKVGEEVTAQYTSKKPKRTESQNRYYWGCYLPMIASESGHDIHDLHTLFKGKFLGKEIAQVLGEKIRRTQSTTELTTGQFADYIRRIEELTGILAPPTEEYIHGEVPVGKIDYPENTSGEPTF